MNRVNDPMKLFLSKANPMEGHAQPYVPQSINDCSILRNVFLNLKMTVTILMYMYKAISLNQFYHSSELLNGLSSHSGDDF